MKVKVKHNYLLTCCVLILAMLCILSIYGPIHFKQQQTERETEVKHHLVQIRLAEEKYRMATGGFTASFDTLIRRGLLTDSLRFVPHTNHKQFEIETAMQLTKSGRQLPLMECRAYYADFLEGLDQQAIQQLIDDENAAGRFPGLKIGDLNTSNNNAGNWE